MLGTVVNTAAIIAGSLIGLLFRGGIPQRFSATITHAIGLAVALIGIKTALKSDDILVIIASLALGALAGEWIGIEAGLERLGGWIGRKVSKDGEGVSRGFVSTSLLYCVGAMAIVGAMESGLSGDHQTLYAKSVLDGVGSVLFASTLGVGVLFSAVSVFVYQGLITVSAAMIKPFLLPEVVAQMSAVGGLLIFAIGLGLLDIARIRIGNLLPAIFVPLLYQMLKGVVGAA